MIRYGFETVMTLTTGHAFLGGKVLPKFKTVEANQKG
jgi:hypothetical protein